MREVGARPAPPWRCCPLTIRYLLPPPRPLPPGRRSGHCQNRGRFLGLDCGGGGVGQRRGRRCRCRCRCCHRRSQQRQNIDKATVPIHSLPGFLRPPCGRHLGSPSHGEVRCRTCTCNDTLLYHNRFYTANSYLCSGCRGCRTIPLQGRSLSGKFNGNSGSTGFGPSSGRSGRVYGRISPNLVPYPP